MSSQVQTRAQTFINAIGRALSIIGMILLVVMMLFTGSDVFLRYVFNRPILGSTEITELMMLILAFTTIVWCTAGKAHIKVDLLSDRIPDMAKIVSDILFYLLSLILCSFIGWRSFLEALALWPTKTYAGSLSPILDIPHHPFYIFISVACGLIALILLIYIGQGIARVVKRWT